MERFLSKILECACRQGLQLGRVVEEQKESYRVLGESGEMTAEITGRLRHMAADKSAFPVVGDWVVMDATPPEGKGRIHEVLPRRSKLSRKAAGARAVEQALVSNVDVAFVVMSLNADLNPRRLERYLSTIWDGGALPVVLLSKADLCEDRQRAVRFSNCSHDTEPGCAVLEAIACGTPDQDRLLNYRKLRREQQFLERRRDQAARAEQKRISKQRHRALKQHYKLKASRMKTVGLLYIDQGCDRGQRWCRMKPWLNWTERY